MSHMQKAEGRPFQSLRYDIAIACLLAIAGAILIWHCSHQIPAALRGDTARNVWFESDVYRVYCNISLRWSDQYRTKVHPVFPLFTNPVSNLLTKGAGFSLDQAANTILTGIAGLWAAALYLLLRRLNLDPGMAFLTAAAGLASSSFLLFFSVPETYGMASLSVVLALLIAALSQGKRWETAGAVAAGALSLSMTVTNWALGGLLSFDRRRFWHWVQICVNAFFVVTVLWSVQKAIMPTAEFFTAFSEEQKYSVRPTPLRFLKAANAFVFHGAIAPAVEQTRDFGLEGELVGPDWPLGLTFQNSGPGSGSYWGAAAAILWAGALALGVRRMVRSPRGRIATAVLGFLALQLALHLVYGVETFMYALDWLPALLIVAAFGFNELGRARWAALAVFTTLLAVNNSQQFSRITATIDGYQRERPIAHPLTAAEIPQPPR